MTDEQIIKGLECCYKTANCKKCPYNCYSAICIRRLEEDALSLINRQKAEIERLTEEVEIKSQKRANIFEISSAYERGKTEAITAYHEEVKKRCLNGGIFPAFVNRQMEDVRKEMVGESK